MEQNKPKRNSNTTHSLPRRDSTAKWNTRLLQLMR
jgi:hypothetical protein